MSPPVEPNSADADAQALEHALRVFTADLEGRLRFDEQAATIKYVVEPREGRMVLSVPVAVFFAAELVLDVPEESDDALQLLLTVEECGESAATDRWQAYHGQPEHVRWALGWVDGAKHGAWVFDGDAFALPHPFAAEESVLCRVLNADKARLAAICQRHAGVVVPDPVCVGVDPRGVHVRARFGVVRVAFEEMAADAAEARRMIEGMMARG
jgi:hypothetical protein